MVDLEKGISDAPPSTLEDLQLNESEADIMSDLMIHAILQIIVQ